MPISENYNYRCGTFFKYKTVICVHILINGYFKTNAIEKM